MEDSNNIALPDNSISFLEEVDERNNQVATVLIDQPGYKKAIIAYIHKEQLGKSTVYRSYDSDGKELYAPVYSLRELKKTFIRHEEEFIAKTKYMEQARALAVEELQQRAEKRKNKTKAIRASKAKQRSLTRNR